MSRLIGIMKSIYLEVFNRLAYRTIRHRPGSYSPAPGRDVINVVCRYGVPNGLSNGALYQLEALARLGYEVRKVDVTTAIRNPLARIACEDQGVFIFHCAAPQFLQLAWPLRQALKGHRLIGYFAWELGEPPADWPVYTGVWDEIWTTSRFSAHSLAKKFTCPIHVVGHVRLQDGAPRVWQKGKEPLTFLTMADARSSLMRKNPEAVIAAFREAFADAADAALVVKLSIREMTPQVQRILDAAAEEPRITVITGDLTRAEIDALFSAAHVYVSLHRAEGFGLPLLEARTSGLATIATAWSGNLDFMSDDDSILIPCELAEMLDEGGVYGQVTWANPDIHAAAGAMRRLYAEPDEQARIARAGWETSRAARQLQQYSNAIAAALGTADQPG
jgi:glycosyltransferase involved in cell wall biosynthesis